VEQVRDWFLSLREHPERYQFDTHAGFEFVQGDFGEPGARFRTRERFACLVLELSFELTRVERSEFWFRLARPRAMGIWGKFDLEPGGEGRTVVSLAIGSETRAGQLILRAYPVAALVDSQIHAEVEHVKASIERM
jgi:hypothetical protein